MEEKEKAQLASNLKNAAEEMLSLNEMENVEGGGIVDINPKCVQNKVADRKGGYTRMIKIGMRKGDGAPEVIIELV